MRRLKDVELVSVCDTNLGGAKAFASNWGVPAAFDSLELMLRDQRLDAVHVLAPPDQHHALLAQCFSPERMSFSKSQCVHQSRRRRIY